MRSLYRRSAAFRWIIALILAAAVVFLLPRLLGFLGPVWSLVAFPLWMSALQFSLAPTMRVLGLYRYHSPMLKVTLRSSRRYELHGGTLFDYVMTVRWAERGTVASRRIVAFYLEGLLEIAREVEAERLPRSIEITGTSYFFSEQTARRLGFAVLPAGLRLRANLLLNFLDVCALYSFSKGRLAVPAVWRAREAVIRGGELVANKPAIQQALCIVRREVSDRVGRFAACA